MYIFKINNIETSQKVNVYVNLHHHFQKVNSNFRVSEKSTNYKLDNYSSKHRSSCDNPFLIIRFDHNEELACFSSRKFFSRRRKMFHIIVKSMFYCYLFIIYISRSRSVEFGVVHIQVAGVLCNLQLGYNTTNNGLNFLQSFYFTWIEQRFIDKRSYLKIVSIMFMVCC